MSITTNITNTTKYLYAGLGALTLIGALGVASLTASAGWTGSDAAQEALRAGDYEAFVASVQADDGRGARRMGSLDEEKFLQLQDKFLMQEMLQDAIEAGDWDVYQEVVAGIEDEGVETRAGRRKGWKMIAETEGEFEELVMLYQERVVFEEEVRLAVETGDQDGFESLLQEQLAQMQERLGRRWQSRELSAEKIEELYTQAQESAENGEGIRLRPKQGRGAGRR